MTSNNQVPWLSTGRYSDVGYELIDTEGNVIATLVGHPEDIRMDSVSTFDHITEPRNVEDYSIQPIRTKAGQDWFSLEWALFPDKPYTLGMVQTREEGDRLLQHLRQAAVTPWEAPSDRSSSEDEPNDTLDVKDE